MYEEYARIRDKLGLTDYDVAKACGISQASLSRWKTGKSSPSKKTRLKICNVLGVPATTKFSDTTDVIVADLIDQQRVLQHKISAIKYKLTLADKSEIELTLEEAEELNRAVETYIQVYCENLLKLHERKKDDQ